MNMKQYSIFALLLAIFTLNSCGVYKKYQSQSVAEVSWREFFTDPLLRQLIDSALVRNTDMQSASLAVEQAQASLKAAKLAYLPSLSLAPQGSVSGTMSKSGSTSSATWAYNIPLQLDWNIGIAGSVTVNKRKAKAVLEQAKAMREATQANLIATVAQAYYQLLLLDRGDGACPLGER